MKRYAFYFLMAILVVSRVLLIIDHERTKVPAVPSSTTAMVNNTATVQEDTCGHAVACGGVHSVSDLKKELSDPAVRTVEPRFIPDGAILSYLPTDTRAHVAYRKNGKIYFTKEDRTIHAGDAVWMDRYGHIILAHCGNILEYATPEPTSEEPADIYPVNLPDGIVSTPKSVDVPEPPQVVDVIPGFTVPAEFPAPPTVDQYAYLHPSEPYIPCCNVWVPGPVVSPTPTPEPVSMVLMGSGMVGLAAIRKYRSKGNYIDNSRK